MHFIKLDAIDSTNDFLKKLAAEETLPNYTVVSAENQTKGKGQMGAKWISEPGKSLIMSLLVKDALKDINGIFDLSRTVALAVLEVLKKHEIPGLSVKWPNDIMSGNRKIGGILIENSTKGDGNLQSVIGIGLNVNQLDFEHLPKASSLALVAQKQFDKEILLHDIAMSIQERISVLYANPGQLLADYNESLFKRKVPMAFRDKSGHEFMGAIQSATADGKLQLMLEDDSLATFSLKEIELLY